MYMLYALYKNSVEYYINCCLLCKKDIIDHVIPCDHGHALRPADAVILYCIILNIV